MARAPSIRQNVNPAGCPRTQRGLGNPPVRSRNNRRAPVRERMGGADVSCSAAGDYHSKTRIPPECVGDPPRPPASCGFPLEPPSRSEVEYQGASAIPRELIEPHRGDKRHVTSQKRKVLRSAKQCQPPLSADRRSKAKTIVEGRGGSRGSASRSLEGHGESMTSSTGVFLSSTAQSIVRGLAVMTLVVVW